MSELFERLNPSQLTAVLCSFAGAVTLVVFILSVLHYQLRALSDQTALERERQNADIAMQKEQVMSEIALKQELVKRNLPPEELRLVLETLGAVSAAPEPEAAEEESAAGGEDQAARVLKQLAYYGDVDGDTIEETVALVAATDPSALGTLAEVLDDCIANDHSGDVAYSIARAYCQAHPQAPAAEPEHEPSGGA